MAGDGATYKGGIKAYWKRRGYGRLDPASSAQRRPRLPTAELGGGGAAGGGGEYDEKALVEIYRSILARGGGGVVPVAGDAAAVVAVARLTTVA
uniref:Uncharacterized protein n=1 Tax=Oryza punctata TaxID=4537 RepID=A0A0E0L1H1_ORYPU